MKKLLLITLILITVMGCKTSRPIATKNNSITDSTFIFKGGDSSMILSPSIASGNLLFISNPPPTYDTSKVIMLVCDTLHYSNYVEALNKRNYFDKSGVVTWVTGYQISKHEYWKFPLNIGYLDSNRKPLPKTTVIWISKQL